MIVFENTLIFTYLSCSTQAFVCLKIEVFLYRTKKNEASDAPVDTVQHEYNYISEVPLRQSLSVGYVNTGTGLAEVKPSVDQQYEEIGGNQRQYPQMYSTPIQETNSEEIKKYENMPVTKVCIVSSIPPPPPNHVTFDFFTLKV